VTTPRRPRGSTRRHANDAEKTASLVQAVAPATLSVRDVRARGPGRLPGPPARWRHARRGRRAHPGCPERRRLACCGSVDVTRAVLDSRPTRMAGFACQRNYMALLLDLEEVRPRPRRRHRRLTTEGWADRLLVADKVTRKLIAGGHLRAVTVINPVNRCPVTIVPTEDIERFNAEFVTCSRSLASKAGITWRQEGARGRRREASDGSGGDRGNNLPPP